MFKKKKEANQIQGFDYVPPPLALPEILYITEEIHFDHYDFKNNLIVSPSLVEAAKKSRTHKVGVYQLTHTTCVEYVQPEPIARTIDCPQEK